MNYSVARTISTYFPACQWSSEPCKCCDADFWDQQERRGQGQAHLDISSSDDDNDDDEELVEHPPRKRARRTSTAPSPHDRTSSEEHAETIEHESDLGEVQRPGSRASHFSNTTSNSTGQAVPLLPPLDTWPPVIKSPNITRLNRDMPMSATMPGTLILNDASGSLTFFKDPPTTGPPPVTATMPYRASLQLSTTPALGHTVVGGRMSPAGSRIADSPAGRSTSPARTPPLLFSEGSPVSSSQGLLSQAMVSDRPWLLGGESARVRQSAISLQPEPSDIESGQQSNESVVLPRRASDDRPTQPSDNPALPSTSFKMPVIRDSRRGKRPAPS